MPVSKPNSNNRRLLCPTSRKIASILTTVTAAVILTGCGGGGSVVVTPPSATDTDIGAAFKKAKTTGNFNDLSALLGLTTNAPPTKKLADITASAPNSKSFGWNEKDSSNLIYTVTDSKGYQRDQLSLYFGEYHDKTGKLYFGLTAIHGQTQFVSKGGLYALSDTAWNGNLLTKGTVLGAKASDGFSNEKAVAVLTNGEKFYNAVTSKDYAVAAAILGFTATLPVENLKAPYYSIDDAKNGRRFVIDPRYPDVITIADVTGAGTPAALTQFFSVGVGNFTVGYIGKGGQYYHSQPQRDLVGSLAPVRDNALTAFGIKASLTVSPSAIPQP